MQVQCWMGRLRVPCSALQFAQQAMLCSKGNWQSQQGKWSLTY